MTTLRTKSLLPVILVVVLVGGISGSAIALRSSSRPEPRQVAAAPAAVRPAPGRPAPESGCTGLRCSGLGTGGYGNHYTNTNGTGQFAGYNAVRMDAFRPVPGLQECTNPDRTKYDELGIPGNFEGPTYLHRRVIVNRGSGEVVAGIEDTPNWGVYDYNADTGATRPTQTPEKAPSHAGNEGPWIGSEFVFPNVTCLPLNGGADVEAVLQEVEPVIAFRSPKGVTGDLPRAVIGMKSITLDATISQSRLRDNGVDIYFTLADALVLVCDVDLGRQLRIEAGLDPEAETLHGCYLSDNPDSPIFVNTGNVTYEQNADGTELHTTLAVKFKRTGHFRLALVGIYDATVNISGGPITEATGLSGGSNLLDVNVISVKSVNRKD